MRHAIRLASVAAGCLALLHGGCRPAATPPPSTTPNVVVASAATLPTNPDDAAWDSAPEHVAQLLPQDMVEPRQLEPSTAEIRVRAVADGTSVAFRLQWSDETDSNLPGAANFCDACAVQVPAKHEPTVPAPQMGEPGRPVQITYWNAAWQATVDGRGDTIQDIYPRATVDHYPFDAKTLDQDPAAKREMSLRYAPARALGNLLAGPRQTPVQDLLAEGPGTLRPAASGQSRGSGLRADGGWSVVLSRPLPEGLAVQSGTQVAFAVWDGGLDEVGARKMRTGWIELVLAPTTPSGQAR